MADADPFEAFVREYQDMVFATAVRLLGRPADAEDVAQTVFLKAFEHFGQLADSPTAAGWLKTVATNMCLNHLSRYRARWRLFSEMAREDADADEAGFETRIAGREAADEAVDRADQQAELEAALHRLPDHQRVPIVLYHFEERSYQDIATALGVSLGKIKTDIHRGREALKKHLA